MVPAARIEVGVRLVGGHGLLKGLSGIALLKIGGDHHVERVIVRLSCCFVTSSLDPGRGAFVGGATSGGVDRDRL